jgi:hypothetical protein
VRSFTVSQATACARYGAEHRPAYYLLRPDQHVSARWRKVTGEGVLEAAARAIGRVTV